MKQFTRFVSLATVVALGSTADFARAEVPAGNDPRPTLVTVHLHDVPFDEAVAAIGKQAGVQVNCYNQGAGPAAHVTVDADGKPFWQVLCDATDQAHWAVAPPRSYGTATDVVVVEPVGTAGRTGRDVAGGPALAIFSQVEHLDQLTAPAAQADFCELAVDVIWEPRLNVAFFEAVGRPDEAVDENGRSLVAGEDPAADSDPRSPNSYRPFGKYDAPQRQYFGQNGVATAMNGMRYSVRLTVPPTAGRQLAHVRGQIKLWVAGPDAKVEVPDVVQAGKGKGMSFPFGQLLNLHVSNVNISDNYLQAQISVPRNGMLPAEWDQMKTLLHSSLRIKALNAAGQVWGSMQGQPGDQQQNDSLTMWVYVQPATATGTGSGKPDRLVIEGPMTSNEIDVPYDLHALPLP